MTSNVTLFKTYETDIFFAIEIIQLIILISALLFEKQKLQYNRRFILHSRTAQCIIFEYFLFEYFTQKMECEFLKTVTRLNKRLEAPFSCHFLFFHFGLDIFDIHISHRRFFLIEKEISITKRYKYLVSRHFC